MDATRPGYGNLLKEESMQGLFNKAESALSENRPDEAVACFDMVLRDDPFNARAHSGLSRAYWEQGRTEDALNSITRALEIEPDDRDTILQCSRLFQALGKKDFADEVLNSYLARNPGDYEVRLAMNSPSPAIVQAAAGLAAVNIAAANRNLQSALPEGPGEADSAAAEIFRNQGVIEFERGRLDRAVVCFEMAIEKNPQLAEAYSDLGVVHQQSGNLREALEHFLKALELKPDDPDVLSNSARALSQAGEIESAMDLFRHYLRVRPDDEEAWTEYDELIRRGTIPEWGWDGGSPEVAAIYIETAVKLMSAGALPAAAEAIDKALKINPDAPDALFVLASLHNEIGQKDDAVSILERALSIDPARKDCRKLLKSIKSGVKGGA